MEVVLAQLACMHRKRVGALMHNLLERYDWLGRVYEPLAVPLVAVAMSASKVLVRAGEDNILHRGGLAWHGNRAPGKAVTQ